MRILFVVHQFLPEFAAGTESVTLNLAHCAQSGGHHVEVLTYSTREAELWDGVDVAGLRYALVQGVRVSAIPKAAPDDLPQYGFGHNAALAQAALSFLDARAAFDVVHITHSLRMMEVAELVRERGLPYVLTLTDFFLDCYQINLRRRSGELCEGPRGGLNCIAFCPLGLEDADMLRRQARTARLLEGAAAVNACSDYVAGVVRREHPDIPLRVTPHGIDLRRFGPPRARAEGASLVFGYIGTLSEIKGVHILAEAFADAAPPDARLDLVGPCFDEAFKARLQRLSERAPNINLGDAVAASAVPARLSGFDVLCLPALWPETFSLAIYEGFAAGLPCLVSDLGWPGELVRRQGCGQAIVPGDVAAWRGAIDGVVRDPARLEAWRSNTPLPRRMEEEGFVYHQLYRQAVLSRPKVAPGRPPA